MSSMPRESSAEELRQDQIGRYWVGDLARKTYLFRKQRKAILEHCRRIAVVGASADPNSSSFIAIEKLLGLGLEIIPVFPGRESLLGLRCFSQLRDVPGKLDIVQVYPNDQIDYEQLAHDAVLKNVNTFWLEPGLAASKALEEILLNGQVHLVEYENLETEYLKHMPYSTGAAMPRKDKRGTKVRERMSRNPATVKPDDGLKDAMWKMEHGHFRHLPVVDDQGKLIGMLTDRDIRSIQPSNAFVSKDDAAVQLWSISVQQAAVFDPITVKPDHSLREAAEIMLRWHVGGLPVVEEHDRLVGMITYTDVLREFVGRDEAH
ncbi:MAG TPA: CBS domain-containing protein [Candidatus Binatus sp.]|nr:CBS domain-containing protein [Candidatus Binatus sp.]